MAPQARRSSSLERLFNLDDARLSDRSKLSASGQPDEIDDRGAAVTHLATAAIQLLAGKSVGDGNHAPVVSEHFVEAFCKLLMKGKMQGALNLTRSFACRGADYGDIAEGLFAAAARSLGDKWAADEVSLVDVNIGISTLTRTHIALCSGIGEPKLQYGLTALFGWFEGQSHTLGIEFAAEFFRHNGWSVRYMPATTPGQFLTMAADDCPDLVGLTATTDKELNVLHRSIARLRMLPLSPRIIVGGSSPHLATLKADAIVTRLDMGLLAGRRVVQ